MSESKKYATDALFPLPIIDAGTQDFVGDYVPAGGDAKVWTDTLIETNLSCFILGFDSLSERPSAGDQIDENGAGTAQAVVMFTIITSGTVGGGDAAGFFFVKSVSGQAWSNNDQIDINGGTANIATADSTTHDLAATAGLVGVIATGRFVVAATAVEMTCSQGQINIIDSATKAIEDQAVVFHTYGNAAALHAVDLDDSVRAGLTALPNFAAGSAGGLPDDTDANGAVRIVDGTGAREINTNSGAIVLVDTVTTNTDVRGTDNAALASVLGALNDAAAAGDVTTADTLMQYLKQAINLMAGAPGIATNPSAAVPANAVNMFEILNSLSDRLPAALVSGAMDADVSVMQNGTIVAATYAAGARDAAGQATDAVDEIRDAMLPTQNVIFNFKYVWVAASDHVTPVTGATGTTVTRSIDGGAFGAATGTLSEIANGVYRFVTSAADMNGGEITFRFVATGGTPGAPDDAFVHITTGGGV